MKSLKKYWALMEDVLSGTFLVTGITLIFYETVMRFLFNSSKAWIGEVSIYLIIWGALFGIAVALRNKRHVQIDFLYDFLSPFYRRIVDLFSVSVGIIFCIFYIYYGGSLVMHNYQTGMSSMNASIPLWVVYLILPTSGILFCLRFIEQFIHAIRGEEINDDSTV
ncbi:TRAP transporter small permease [Oceanobacillus longus]|uniref:TRAP transporter small permease n=1 Tax=Oceanobacillus longus TaxID=930120 RepID=A0ABV8H2X3_9BACI